MKDDVLTGWLALSTRARKGLVGCLMRHGFTGECVVSMTKEDVVATRTVTMVELLKTPNCGRVTSAQIVRWLNTSELRVVKSWGRTKGRVPIHLLDYMRKLATEAAKL